MSHPPIPLGDIAISIRTIACLPNLTLEGIDLDSGRAAKIEVSDETLRTMFEQIDANPADLVLVLSLYAMTPLDAA